MSIIADSGPILSFARANQLELLHQVIGGLTIPDAVYEDIVVRGAGKPGSTEVQGASWIRPLPVRDRVFVDQLPPKLVWSKNLNIALWQGVMRQSSSNLWLAYGHPISHTQRQLRAE